MMDRKCILFTTVAMLSLILHETKQLEFGMSAWCNVIGIAEFSCLR